MTFNDPPSVPWKFHRYIAPNVNVSRNRNLLPLQLLFVESPSFSPLPPISGNRFTALITTRLGDDDDKKKGKLSSCSCCCSCLTYTYTVFFFGSEEHENMDGKDFWEITGGVLCPCPAFWFVCFPLQMQQLSIVSESKSRENLFFFHRGNSGKRPEFA